MKIQAPNGTLLEFPDDATDAEIEDFFNKDWKSLDLPQGTGPEPVTFDPSSQFARAEMQRAEMLRRFGQTTPMGGPFTPETALMPGQLISGAADVAGAVLEPVTDIAGEYLRSIGLTPPPKGRGIVQAEDIPFTPFAVSPAGAALRLAAPETFRGVETGIKEMWEGLTEPGLMLSMPAGATRAGLGYFGGSIASTIPESIRALYEAESTQEGAREAVKLGGGLLMGGLIGRSLLREPVPATRGTTDASRIQKTTAPYGDVPAQPGEGPGQVPAAERGAGIRPEAQRVAQETQVLLERALEENRRQGLGHELDILDRFPDDPENLRIFRAQPARVDAEGNYVSPGRISLNLAALELARGETPAAQWPEALARALNEEGLHAITTAKEALSYLETLTGTEAEIGKRNYLGGRTEAEIGLAGRPDLLGFELLRQRMQQLMGLTTTEVAELAGRQRWGVRSLEIISNILRRFRELIGTQAAKAGKRITQDILSRAEENVQAALEAVEGAEYKPPEYGEGIEAPFAIRRVRGYDFDPDIADRDVRVTVSKLSLPDGRDLSYVQTDGIVNGQNIWSLNPELMREAGHDIPSSPEILASVPTGRYTLSQIRDMLAEKPQAPEAPEGTVRLYHGEGAAEGAGFGTSWFTKDWARAASYGDQISYVDVPQDVASQAQARARQSGSGTSSDHLLPSDVAKRAKPLPERLQPKIYDVGPGGIRRKRAQPSGPEFQFGTSLTGKLTKPETEAAAEALAKAEQARYEPLTANALNEAAARHLTEEAAPDFSAFVSEARTRFGPDLKPGQLRDAWEDAVWRRLSTASGAELSSMARQIGLAKQLKLETPGGEWKQIPDPAPQMPAVQRAAPQMPGITRPWFVMPGRPLRAPLQGPSATPVYGPIAPWRPTRGGKALSAAQFTKGQQLRARVIAAIGEKLISKAEGGRRFLARKDIEPEEVADPRVQTKEPVYQEFTTAEQADAATLGARLTQDARAPGGELTKRAIGGQVVTTQKRGFPVSATKRLTAIQNKQTGKVSLVSTYRDGRRGPVLLDPQAPKGTHSPISSILGRYRVVASVLLDEPVQNFRRDFSSLGDYENQFGKAAQRAARRGEEYEAPRAEEGEVYEPSQYRLNEPVSAQEVESIIGHLEGEVGIFDSPTDVLLAIEDLQRSPKGEVVSGYAKLANSIEERNPGLGTEQIVNRIAEQLYEDYQQAQNFEDFQRRTISRGPAGRGEAAGPEVPPEPGPAAEEGGIEVPPTPKRPTTRFASLSRATQGPFAEPPKPFRQPPPKPPAPGRMLSAAEQEYVARMAEEKYPQGLAPASIRRLAKGSAKLVDKIAVEPLRLYSEWMNERLRRVGGHYSGVLSDVVDMAIQGERDFYGKLTPLLDPARKAAGAFGRGTQWLHGLRKITPNAGIANTVGAIEGTLNVPPYAQPIVDVAQQANLAIGRLYQKANPRFTATGKFQRNLTALGFDIIRQGTGEAWQKLAQGTAVANKMPLGDVVTFLRKWKRVLDESGPTTEAIERVNQDFQRKFPKAITHIRHAGQWQAILHADLFNYLETAARRASHVAAFREIFPPTKASRAAFSRLMADVRAETPGWYHDDLTALMRALQGHPTDNYIGNILLRPGQPISEAARFINQTAGNLMAKQVLTGQMFVQPGENIAGSTPVFLGYRNYLRGLARLRELYPELEQRGSVNRVMLDFSFDPTSPVRSVFRMLGNTTGKVFAEHLLNELQEGAAAATAAVVVERIKNGTLSKWEKAMLPQTFKAMGFTPGQVLDLMKGNPDLLQRFEGKAASFLTSGNKAIAEGSRLGANRLFGSIFRFQSYAMMKANQLRKVTAGAIDAWQTGTPMEKAAATYLLTRFLFGAAVQGAITVGITSLFYEGVSALNIRKQEAKDEPFHFFVESMLSAMSGPFYLAWRGARDKGLPGMGEQFSRAIFPFQIMRELYSFAWGLGPYRDLNQFDRIGRFIRSKVPGTKAISQGLALAGLSQDNAELDAAISAFHRWQRKELGLSGNAPVLWSDDRKPFRMAIRRAIEAMKNGDDAAYDRAIDEANQYAERKGQTKTSLRSKTILKGPEGRKLTEEELDALRKRIGDRAVDMLEDFDDMLGAVK